MRYLLMLSIVLIAACSNNTDVTIEMESQTSLQGANSPTEPVSHVPVIVPASRNGSSEQTFGLKCGVIHKSGSQAEMLKELNNAITDGFNCCQLE